MANETPQRPQTAQELRDHLARTLVQTEVVEPMNKIGWQFGTPPAPGEVTDNPPSPGAPPTPAPVAEGTTPTPAPAPGVTANVPASPASEIDWESLKDPKTGLYIGKYTSKEEAAKGIGHAVTMAKDALARAERAEAALTQQTVQSQIQPAPSPGAAPQVPAFVPASRAEYDAANAKLDAVLSRVAEEGGLLDADAAKSLKDTLREVVQLGARSAAEEVVTGRDAAKAREDAKWDAVDKHMSEKYPGSDKFADEIGLFVESNPLIRSAIGALTATGKEVDAAELAWIEFEKARGNGQAAAALAAATTKEIQMEAADQVRREAVDAARKDAGVITSSAGGVHETPNLDPSRDEIEAAAQGMRAYGSTPGNPAAARWRELVITRHLPKDVFYPQ